MGLQDRQRYTLIQEPIGELYQGLIDQACGICEIVLLVVQPSLGLQSRAEALLGSLQPFLLDRRQTAAWPGTRLINETAWVSRFRLTPECALLLKSATVRLYDWQQPELPEDLALLRGDGTTWLASIAHEGDGFLELSPDELQALRAALPQLTLRAD